jgi:hypothetical protein
VIAQDSPPTLTYLHMLAPGDLRPAPLPSAVLGVQELDQGSPLIRSTTSIGGHFLTVGVRLAWTIAPEVSRVWLHTSSRDHSHALPNYERRGFRRCRAEPDALALT